MPIDASIYGAFAPRVKSVQELDNEWTRGQMNQLALMGAQAEAQERERQRQEADALAETVRGFGDDRTANYNALLRRGLLKPAEAYQKNSLDALKAQADIGKTNADAEKERLATARQKFQTLADVTAGVRDPQSYSQARTLLMMQGFDLSGVPEQYDPAFVENARQWALTQAQRVDNEWKQRNFDEGVRQFGVTSAETSRHNTATEATARGNLAVAQGQLGVAQGNLGVARERLTLDKSNNGAKAPAGYRYKADGSLEAIPGGPADIKAGELGAKAEARKQSQQTQAASVLDTVADAKKLVGWNTAGVGGLLSKVPATDARNLKAKLETIKANLGFDRLQQMRDQSPTGGALGQVAVQELQALQSTVASLDQMQGTGELTAALNKIDTHYRNWLRTLSGGGASGDWGGKEPAVVDFSSLK